MKHTWHSRWLALCGLAVGILCQAGPCAALVQSEEGRQLLGQTAQQTAVSAFADTLFFLLDNLLVRFSG
ncbi:MAG: hypothetical protein PVJ57_17360 [Phycisphaerae bacterium]|jgi:hypothetical protein